MRGKAGDVLDILLSAEVIRVDGHHGYLKMSYNVTERKRNETQMHLAIQSIMRNAGRLVQPGVRCSPQPYPFRRQDRGLPAAGAVAARAGGAAAGGAGLDEQTDQ